MRRKIILLPSMFAAPMTPDGHYIIAMLSAHDVMPKMPHFEQRVPFLHHFIFSSFSIMREECHAPRRYG